MPLKMHEKRAATVAGSAVQCALPAERAPPRRRYASMRTDYIGTLRPRGFMDSDINHIGQRIRRLRREKACGQQQEETDRD